MLKTILSKITIFSFLFFALAVFSTAFATVNPASLPKKESAKNSSSLPASTTASTPKPTQAKPTTVKIGVILPLTGNNANLGQPQMAAIELFRKECATDKTLKHKYEVIVEDDQLSGRLTAEATNKLINLDHVDAIMAFSSTSGNVLAPRTKQAGIPLIAIASDGKIANGKNNFIHWPTPSDEVGLQMQVLKKLGTKRLAVLALRQQGVIAVLTELQAQCKKEGIEIVSNVMFNPGERDFRAIIAGIREKNPDTFIPLAFSPELEIILRQRKQVGLDNVKVTGMEVFDLVTEAGLAENVFYVTGSIGTPEFQAKLKATTGVPAAYCTPYTYDCLALFRSAYEQSPLIDRVGACKYLATLKDYPSSVGGTLTVDPRGIFHSQPAIFKIKNGHPTPATLDEVK